MFSHATSSGDLRLPRVRGGLVARAACRAACRAARRAAASAHRRAVAALSDSRPAHPQDVVLPPLRLLMWKVLVVPQSQDANPSFLSVHRSSSVSLPKRVPGMIGCGGM